MMGAGRSSKKSNNRRGNRRESYYDDCGYTTVSHYTRYRPETTRVVTHHPRPRRVIHHYYEPVVHVAAPACVYY